MDEASFVRMFEARFGPDTRIDGATIFREIEGAWEQAMVPMIHGATLIRIIEEVYGPEMVPRKLDFILDSGAAYHMIRACDARFLSNLRDPSSPMCFEAADGNKLTATAIGDIDSEYIKLKGVHVVRDLKVNLVSTYQLADEENISTTFGKNSAELFKGGERVGGAIIEGRSYIMRFLCATEDAAPHTSPAGPGEHITSYVANAASSHMKDVVTNLKAKDADWVTILKDREADRMTSLKAKDPAVLVRLVESFKDKYMICGDLFAPTAKMDESDETGGAAGYNSMIRDGSFVPGKAHLGSEGMHGTNFMKVQLNA